MTTTTGSHTRRACFDTRPGLSWESAGPGWPQAIAQLQEGLKICGDCRALALLHKNLGLIYCRSGDLKSGRVELLEARQLAPKDPDITAALQLLEKLSK